MPDDIQAVMRVLNMTNTFHVLKSTIEWYDFSDFNCLNISQL